jgi:hypothetical protein
VMMPLKSKSVTHFLFFLLLLSTNSNIPGFMYELVDLVVTTTEDKKGTGPSA